MRFESRKGPRFRGGSGHGYRIPQVLPLNYYNLTLHALFEGGLGHSPRASSGLINSETVTAGNWD